jgi:predicted solute-binding protein
MHLAGDVDMCTVFEETRTEGRAEEIIAMGDEFGLSESDILSKLQEKLNISSQKAQEYLWKFRK